MLPYSHSWQSLREFVELAILEYWERRSGGLSRRSYNMSTSRQEFFGREIKFHENFNYKVIETVFSSYPGPINPTCPNTPIFSRPPAGGKTIYATRKIRSAVPRVNVPEKEKEVREVKSPTFEMTRTPTNIGVKVQIDESESLEMWVLLFLMTFCCYAPCQAMCYFLCPVFYSIILSIML